MNLSIEEILDKMEDLIDGGANIPFAKRSIVSSEVLRDLMYDLRQSLPVEIKQARELVTQRNQFIMEARDEAERIVKDAEERARTAASQQEITRMANNMANDIKMSAQKQAMETRAAAFEYANRMLVNLEDSFARDYDILASCLENIRLSRTNLEKNQ
jgi:vacuolar-type H+-ATPase subunit H